MGFYKRDGDAVAALHALQLMDEKQQQGSANTTTTTDTDAAASTPLWHRHNRAVLENLSSIYYKNDNEQKIFADSLLSMLSIQEESMETPTATAPTPAMMSTVRRYNRLVILYNICLCHYADGKYLEAIHTILNPFLEVMKSIKVDSNGGVKITDLGEALDVDAAAAAAARDANNKDVPARGYLFMATRVAFLVLDCHLALHCGDGRGLGPITTATGDFRNTEMRIRMEDILMWIEKNTLHLTSKMGNFVVTGGGSDLYDSFQHDELKFRLHLYRSKVLFAGESGGKLDDDGDDMNSRIRISRKELKNAMDIYQNKLSVADDEEEMVVGKDEFGGRGGKGGIDRSGVGQQDLSEATSVTSMAGGSFVTSASEAIIGEGKGGVGISPATFEGMPNKYVAQSPQSSEPIRSSATTVRVKNITPSLQAQHKLALYLKANLEYLRGNTSKALKLCAEARSLGKRNRIVRDSDKKMIPEYNNGAPKDTTSIKKSTEWDRHDLELPSIPDGEAQRKSDYDNAIYYNNLGLLHQSAGKVYLALQYYSYALSYMEQAFDGSSSHLNCWSNGLVCPDLRAEILSNKSLCAFHATEFCMAYVCMAQCVKISPCVFGKRARCWLRLAQSCIGKTLAILQLIPTTLLTNTFRLVFFVFRRYLFAAKKQVK